jgi:hypothetical protein
MHPLEFILAVWGSGRMSVLMVISFTGLHGCKLRCVGVAG